MNTATIVQKLWNYCEVIAAEIVEDLEVALEQFREILGDMGPDVTEAEV